MKNFSKFIILFDSAKKNIVYDIDAQLFFDAELLAGVTLTDNEKNAVNQLVLDLKAANIWSKMQFLYPFVGSTATAQKFNLKDPRNLNIAHRLVFHGGWTHSANGALPNGVNGYASTFLIPNTHFGAGFASIGTYVNQVPTIVGRTIGSTNMDILVNTSFMRGANKASTNTTIVATLPMDGFNVNSRISSISTFMMNRSGTFGTGVIAAVPTYATTDIVLGATNQNGSISSYCNGQLALAYCSDFLTQVQSTILKTIVQTFQTTLGRQV
jgi:hypothetical protein